jgi:hypothetical protein
MRTQDEIVNKIKEIEFTDFFGFKTSDLIDYLDYEHAKPYLKPEVTKDQWKIMPTDRESILKEMHEYMSFAWDKANNRRGISASRTMGHYSIWVWMLGDEEIFGNLEDYEYYGKDKLVELCEHYGWDAKQWDNGERVNS